MEIFTFVLAYVSVAYLLFKFPNLVYRKTKKDWPKKKVLIIAHRGGSGEYPENTLAAFKGSSWCDLLEMDVVVTKDNKIVVSHDDTLERLCKVSSKISDRNFSDLPPYSSTIESHFLDAPVTFTATGRFTLLEDVFRECSDSWMCIDVKTPTQEAMEEVTRLVKKFERSQRTILGTNNAKLNEKLREMNQDTLTFMTMGKVILVYFAYFVGVVSLVRIREDVIAMPIMTENFKKLKIKEMGRWRAFVYTKLVDFFCFVSRPLNQHLKKRGVKVFYWTLNTPSEFQKAISVTHTQKDCDGIVTDYPTSLSSYLPLQN